MKNIFSNKKAIIVLIACSLITIIIAIIMKITFFKPKPITEIKTKTVYIGGSRSEYPDNDQSRYYIEFKDNKTFILMYDDTRRNEENYDEDGDGSKPRLDIYFGEYEIKNGNYILKTTDSAGVSFKNTMAVAKKKINYYGRGIFEIEKYVLNQYGHNAERIIFRTGKREYILGYQDNSGNYYDKNDYYYLLFNKSDIKKLPISIEEFRKQFKMDKKAEQERIAEQNR